MISDIIKPHSKAAIAELKKAGVDKCVMLTGDAKKVANQVAASLGIDEVYSELLPADKVDKVEELLRVKLARQSWHLLVTVSMTRRCFPERISVSLWGQWVRMRQLKRRILC